MLTRESFFATSAVALQVEPVDSPIGRGYVRCMTVGEKDRFDFAKDSQNNFRARLLIATVCDEQGSLLFFAKDAPALGQLPVSTAEPFIDAAIRVNKMSKEDQDALRKNSDGQDDSSCSGSPRISDGVLASSNGE